MIVLVNPLSLHFCLSEYAAFFYRVLLFVYFSTIFDIAMSFLPAYNEREQSSGGYS